MSNKSLNLYPIDYPFETLFTRVNSIPPKLILDPDFQRIYKWDKDGNERASKFIESCLMRIPLPACYFAENQDGSHIVIDGVQRITTISRFFKDEFRLEGLTIFKELEGKLFSELGELKNELESTTIRCIILRKENPKELIQEIFARLNQGAVQLSPQEIRHAVFSGSLNDLLIELGQNDIIKEFGKGQNGKQIKNSRENEEMILRFFALQGNLDDYDNLSKYLDNYISNNQNIDTNAILSLKQDFNTTLEKCIAVFEDNVFKDITNKRSKQSLVLYDLQMWSFKNLTNEYIDNHKVKIKNLFKELCKNESFQKTLSGGTQLKSSILRRRQLWLEKLSQIDE